MITDNGIGISETDLPSIFDRFYRTDKARGMDISGTGLGLAIVKKIVEMHGGRVEVESMLGKGSIFRVWLIHCLYGKPYARCLNPLSHASI